MSDHTISLSWTRVTPDFHYDTYNRTHTIDFGDNGKICASAAPEFHGDPTCLDPEQAFAMSLASCHMLTFLAIACKKGYIVDAYSDATIGTLGKNPTGRMAMTRVELRPVVVFSGTKVPTDQEYKELHARAHSGCIIANSVADCVEVVINPSMNTAK